MMDEETMEVKRKEAYQIGNLVLIILVVLTIGEFFFAAIAITWWQPLILIALIKAFYVIKDYMHVSHVFQSEEEGA
jgi:Tfp pilus assembly protein PilZ